jgi:CHAT domain
MANNSHYRGPFVLAILTGLALNFIVSIAQAQLGKQSIPSNRYRVGLSAYYDGETLEALKIFQSEARTGIRIGQSRWIDSICSYTMAGECHYRLGNFPEALENYESALTLYLSYTNWIIRARLPATIRPANKPNVKRQVTWGVSARKAIPGGFSRTYLMSRGNVYQNETFKKGGVVEQATLFSVDMIEVLRCTTLAMRHRMDLLGPVCEHDKMTGDILAAAARKLGLPNHWSACWIDAQFGLAQLAAGKVKLAKVTLQRSLLAAGRFDHPLTACAIFELGRIALNEGDLKQAAALFAETTYSAAFFGDIDLVERGFQYAMLVRFASNAEIDPKPILGAVRWARMNRYYQLECTLDLLLAEANARDRHFKPAESALKSAAGLLSRRDMRRGRIGAEFTYLTAFLNFQNGKTDAGNESFFQAIDYMRHGSLWLWHIDLVRGRYLSGNLTARTAAELFGQVLRDPTANDWMLNPFESISVLTIAHPGAYEAWYRCVQKRSDVELAFEVADRLRRHRYLSTLPFGGRVESLRSILRSEPSSLSQFDRLTRSDLLTAYPAYEKLQKEASGIRKQLVQSPPIDAATGRVDLAKRRNLDLLGENSQDREQILRKIALSRNPASLVFPPLLSTDAIQARLPEGTAMLAFVRAGSQIDAYLINKNQYTNWTIPRPEEVFAPAVSMLRAMGQYEANVELAADKLTDPGWKKLSAKTLQMILAGSDADFATDFKQLIIVPDSFLWYLPFEALQVKTGGKYQSLISRFEIRYAPTAALGVSWQTPRRTEGRTGVVLGKLFPRDKAEVALGEFQRLGDVLPQTVAIQTPVTAPPSLLRVCFDRLVVFDDIQADRGDPYAWQPIRASRVAYGATLADWLHLPAGNPQTLVLPGFHTVAENSFKNIRADAAGQEMFLSLCGLMSTGTRTILLSRWRTGGAIGYGRIREFMQELPHKTPPAAWQRAVLVTQGREIDPEEEPRVKSRSSDSPIKADHPFFWAAEMLVDGGEPVLKDEPLTDTKKPDAKADDQK